jgi:hypothetical protein
MLIYSSIHKRPVKAVYTVNTLRGYLLWLATTVLRSSLNYSQSSNYRGNGHPSQNHGTAWCAYLHEGRDTAAPSGQLLLSVFAHCLPELLYDFFKTVSGLCRQAPRQRWRLLGNLGLRDVMPDGQDARFDGRLTNLLYCERARQHALDVHCRSTRIGMRVNLRRGNSGVSKMVLGVEDSCVTVGENRSD